MRTKRFFAAILDVLAPRNCAFCGALCNKIEGSICTGCLNDLPYHEPAASPLPGKLDSVTAVLNYEFPVDAAIKAFKFHRKSYYASAFAEILLLARYLLPRDVDAVLPVPLHWFRKARRGYNQADELARPLARSLGLPLVRNVRRSRSTPFQSGLDAAERAGNLRQAFTSRGRVDYQHVLIIDDVITTGATLSAVADVLHRVGANRVSALCLASAG